MHEFGLAEGVLAAVRRRAGGRPVRRVRLRAGVRHGVDADSMAQAFRFGAAGTEAEGAGPDLGTLPVHLACRSCGYTGGTGDLPSACPPGPPDHFELTRGA